MGEVLRWADAVVSVLTAAHIASTWSTAELVNVEEQPKPPGFPDLPGRSYFAYASFSDPDGNGWLLQEVTTRLPGREWED